MVYFSGQVMAVNAAEEHYGIVESPYYYLFADNINALSLEPKDKETSESLEKRIDDLRKGLLKKFVNDKTFTELVNNENYQHIFLSALTTILENYKNDNILSID